MRKQLTQLAGFTMIELLVVIAVIGVLAVATLSTINPLEQINKGRDTRTRSDASELLSGIERYYTTQEVYPWMDGIVTQPTGTTIVVPQTAVTDDVDDVFAAGIDGAQNAASWYWLGNLANSNEIKAQFAQRLYNTLTTTTDEDFVIVKGANSDQISACFIPTSKQFKIEAAKKCCSTQTGTGYCNAANKDFGTTSHVAVSGLSLCSANEGVVADANINYICLP